MRETKLNRGVMPLRLDGDKVLLVDQRLLPERLEWFDATQISDMCFAIKEMVVRGAPSIGVAGAFGLACQALRIASLDTEASQCTILTCQFVNRLQEAKALLDETRPTAVNLRWGTEQIMNAVERVLEKHNLSCTSPGDESGCGRMLIERAAKEAHNRAVNLLEEHVECNRVLSQFGAELLPASASVITHCNAGPLAACGWGTALGVVRAAVFNGKEVHVYVDETRPRNQGAKLTMWELQQDDINSTLMCDSMSGFLMSSRKVDLVVVGADRIARNGDTANKIGTYNLAIVAHHHGVPFYVAAPLSTFDQRIECGEQIPIEERHHSEVTTFAGVDSTVSGARAINPAFDVTPARLIAGIITERGILRPPYESSIAAAFAQADASLAAKNC